VLSRKAIKEEFDPFDIDDKKSNIDKQMQNRRDGLFEHFLLPEGNQQNGSPPPSGLIAAIFLSAHEYILPDPEDSLEKQICRNSNNDNK
jgi:hypothetical protein